METITEIKQGYKKTKVGWIPEDWKLSKLKQIGSVTSGGTPSRENPKYWKGDIPWVTTTNIDFNTIYETDECITLEGLKNSSTKLFEVGTLLMAMYGQGKTRGKVAMLGIKATTNQACAAIYFNNIVHNSYIFYNLLNRYNEIRSYSNTGNQENLNGAIIKNILIPLPPLREQQKIAKILSTWDKGIEQNQKLIEQLKARKKGLMQQLLTGKTRLKSFNGEWKEYSYNSLLKEVRRPVKWDDEELYHLISVRRRSGGLFHRESLYGRDILTKNLKTAKTGDYLISKMQILHGASGLTSEKFDGMKISGSYISLRARNEKDLNMEFFSWLSQMPYFYHQTYISSYGVHIEKMTFDFKTFLKLKTSIPLIEEQTAITKILSTADDEIKTQESYLAQLQAQKKGLMQQLLTGQKRVAIN